MVLDLREAARPIVDQYPLDLLSKRSLSKEDFTEDTRGVVRFEPPPSRRADQGTDWWTAGTFGVRQGAQSGREPAPAACSPPVGGGSGWSVDRCRLVVQADRVADGRVVTHPDGRGARSLGTGEYWPSSSAPNAATAPDPTRQDTASVCDHRSDGAHRALQVGPRRADPVRCTLTARACVRGRRDSLRDPGSCPCSLATPRGPQTLLGDDRK